ncbi:MAG TPA: hypothetical protein VFW00_08345 [Rhodocyclaceae bacterium]|nr:hypothetical protein [Rhodocyclaceae bacterium]
MAGKPVLTREQYMDEINRRLREHENFRLGMQAYWTPDDSVGVTQDGVTHDPFTSAGLVASIEKAIRQDFDVAFR